MRFLMKVRIPVANGNAMVKDPQFGEKFQALLGEVKPEAAYFTLDGGQRTAFLIVNLNHAHELPGKVEPFLLAFNADVEATPVMTGEDLATAGPDIANAVKKYG